MESGIEGRNIRNHGSVGSSSILSSEETSLADDLDRSAIGSVFHPDEFHFLDDSMLLEDTALLLGVAAV